MYTRLLWEVPAGSLHAVQARSAVAQVSGCVLVPPAACSSGDQRHVYIGSRGVRCAHLEALLDAWFAHASSIGTVGDGATLLTRSVRRALPAYVLQLEMGGSGVDVTAEPDKSAASFHDWHAVAAAVVDAVAPVWGVLPGALRTALLLGASVDSSNVRHMPGMQCPTGRVEGTSGRWGGGSGQPPRRLSAVASAADLLDHGSGLSMLPTGPAPQLQHAEACNVQPDLYTACRQQADETFAARLGAGHISSHNRTLGQQRNNSDKLQLQQLQSQHPQPQQMQRQLRERALTSATAAAASGQLLPLAVGTHATNNDTAQGPAAGFVTPPAATAVACAEPSTLMGSKMLGLLQDTMAAAEYADASPVAQNSYTCNWDEPSAGQWTADARCGAITGQHLLQPLQLHTDASRAAPATPPASAHRLLPFPDRGCQTAPPQWRAGIPGSKGPYHDRLAARISGKLNSDMQQFARRTVQGTRKRLMWLEQQGAESCTPSSMELVSVPCGQLVEEDNAACADLEAVKRARLTLNPIVPALAGSSSRSAGAGPAGMRLGAGACTGGAAAGQQQKGEQPRRAGAGAGPAWHRGIIGPGKGDAAAISARQPILSVEELATEAAAREDKCSILVPCTVEREHLIRCRALGQVGDTAELQGAATLSPRGKGPQTTCSVHQLAATPTHPQVDCKAVAATCGSLLVALDQHAADERVQLEVLQADLLAERAARLEGPVSGVANHGRNARALLQSLVLRPPQVRLVKETRALCSWGSHLHDTQSMCGFTLRQVKLDSNNNHHSTVRSNSQALELSNVEFQALRAHAAAVKQWGWTVGETATGSRGNPGCASTSSTGCSLCGVPVCCGVALGALDLKLYLHQLAECGSHGSSSAAPPPGVMRVLRSKACRTAVMFNDALSLPECVKLLARLCSTEMPFFCAHGRPTTAPLVDLGVLRRLLKQRWQQQAPSGMDPSRLAAERLRALLRCDY